MQLFHFECFDIVLNGHPLHIMGIVCLQTELNSVKSLLKRRLVSNLIAQQINFIILRHSNCQNVIEVTLCVLVRSRTSYTTGGIN